MNATSEQEFDCICHVCGLVHAVKAVFLSAPQAYCSDGKYRVIHGCGKHERGEVRAAYEHIFKADQFGQYAPLPQAHA